MNIIVQRIFAALEERGLQQKELAKYLSITRGVISQWKSGISNSYNKYLPQIAEYLEVSADWLNNGGLSNDALELMRKYQTLSIKGKLRAMEYMEELVRLYSDM